jgi:hypothetical protein
MYQHVSMSSLDMCRGMYIAGIHEELYVNICEKDTQCERECVCVSSGLNLNISIIRM